VLGEIVAGVLTDVIVTTGVRVTTGLGGLFTGRSRTTIESAFESVAEEAAAGPLTVELAAGSETERLVAEFMGGSYTRSLLHELFSARLCGDPEEHARRLRDGFRAALAEHLSSTGTADARIPADAIFDHLDDRVRLAVDRCRRRIPEVVRHVRRDARLTRMSDAVAAMERHVAALACRADVVAEQKFLDRYHRQVVDHHGRLEPPDFERRRRVPIADIFVAPTIVPVVEVTEVDAPEDIEPIDVADFARRVDRTVLLGDPGGGKTTLSHVLMHTQAAGRTRRVPFLVTVREFASSDPPARSVVAHIEHSLEVFYNCAAPAGLVERLLLHGMAVVIFDGLDELVDSGRRAAVASVIERFCTEYPLAAVLVTSRAVGYDQARLDEDRFVTYRISGFDEERVGEYVRRWFAQEDRMTAEEARGSARDFLNASTAVSDLRTNPLMLALMCILYRGEGSIPRNRPEIYEQCASLLLRRWDARRRIHIDLRARAQIEPLLWHLAHWLFTRQAEPVVTERELLAETTRFLLDRGMEEYAEAAEAARELVEFCRGRAWVFNDAGVTADGEDLYAFTHRTFMEYFAAARLASVHDSPAQLAKALGPRIARGEWEVVAQLAVQIKDRHADHGAERIFARLLRDTRRSEPGRENILAFLARCLAFVSPPARIVRELAGHAVDSGFRPNPYGSARLAPLCWLMSSATEHRETVRNTITGALAERLHRAATPPERAEVLMLAISISDLPWVIARQDERTPGGYWDGVGDELKERWSDAITESAPLHEALAAESFLRRRIDISALLRWHGPDWTVLVRSIPHVEYRGRHSRRYYRYRPLVSELLGGPIKHPDDTWWNWIHDQLRILGVLLNSLPAPPRFDATAEDTDMSCMRFFSRLPESRLRISPGPATAAAGVLLCATAELEQDVPALVTLVERTPHLSGFSSHLRAWAGSDEQPHPLIPAGERFSGLLGDWAAHRFRFTDR
jgi:hypothetical protein